VITKKKYGIVVSLINLKKIVLPPLLKNYYSLQRH
jgi:hypothetical protein